MSFLNKEKADALCTLITLGYSFKIQRKSGGSKHATFQYATQDEMANYQQVKTLFASQYGITINVSQSRPKEEMPLILAQTGRVSASGNINSDFSNTEKQVAKSIEREVLKKNLSYYGAYIGGYADLNKIMLIGASSLTTYSPEYRTITSEDQTDIKASYSKAEAASKGIIDFLSEYITTSGKTYGVGRDKVLVTIRDLVTNVPEYTTDGKLFGSIHGMINAIVFYSTSIDSLAYIFEYACSPKTSKVSSCFPCALFMQSYGTPATSIHLGRGDNWNIPSTCSTTMKNQWREFITECYNEVISVQRKNVSGWDPSDVANNQNIPDIFLEALTYESSFTDRIINTLDPRFLA